MAPTRSQRYSTRKHNRPGPSQAPLIQDAEDDENDEQGEEGEANMDENIVGSAASEVLRKSADLVRLALFCEQRRTVLRRDDILKKVLGSNTRLFNLVYQHANESLNKTFGMQLVELPTRANINQSADDVDEEFDETRRAAWIRKKAAAPGSKTYILRSTLDPRLIEIAAQTDEQIHEEEANEAPSDDEDNEFSEGGYTPRYYGSIISWTRGEQPGPIGILYVILALILVNGRIISDTDLRASLKRLRLSGGGEIPLSALSTHKRIPIDQYLSTLMRQNYIDREQIGDAKGKSKGNKRGRIATQAQDEEEGTAYQWRWGPRAYCEIGEKAVAKFVAEVMIGDRTEVDVDEEEPRAGSSRRGKGQTRDETSARLEKMLKGIEKAAGGNLTDLR
ncbi:hypothetical protein APHAL10511_003071 [Amanita phalloides]|nr:hypothetical protein APHAL10511_003071 [Amanita phalloides]